MDDNFDKIVNKNILKGIISKVIERENSKLRKEIENLYQQISNLKEEFISQNLNKTSKKKELNS